MAHPRDLERGNAKSKRYARMPALALRKNGAGCSVESPRQAIMVSNVKEAVHASDIRRIALASKRRAGRRPALAACAMQILRLKLRELAACDLALALFKVV
jgi:hypothetical protein